jgi:hypothetical protein
VIVQTSLDLEAMALEMPYVARHPNRTEFRGVLTLVDSTSDRAPSGARGHRVVLTRKAAEEALPSLLGMALDYSPSLDRHDLQRKVGVITRADIAGRRLEVGGHLFEKDFPEIVEEVRRSQRRELLADPGLNGELLGMSYEVAHTSIADTRASVWTLTHVTFTGAAILKREKAAYRDTRIEL